MKQKTNTCSLQTLVKEKSKSLLLIPNSDNHWLAKNCVISSLDLRLEQAIPFVQLCLPLFPPLFFWATPHSMRDLSPLTRD